MDGACAAPAGLPPLLFARGNVIAARAAFLTAYAGLPLLYAAFNTFEPVHYWILRGISIASGGMGRTPLDATDSIVIPLGWAVAVWVWRRPVLSPEGLRLRWGLLVAGVAALASIATSDPDPDSGITSVGVTTTEKGSAIIAYGRMMFRSDDGGITWTEERAERSVIWGSGSVLTPRGSYTVEGADIVLLGRDLQAEIVYSTAYLSKSGNLWVQERSTGHLDIRRLATQPRQIVYDERSGNLIVTLGIQGVLVGTPEGQWTPIAVGRYTPTDFSLSGKTRLLLSNIRLWTAALALSLSMTGASLAFSHRAGWVTTVIAILSLLSSAWVMVFASPFASPDANASDSPDVFDMDLLMLALFYAIALMLGTITLAASWQQRYWPAIVTALVGMNVLVVLVFMLWLHLGISLWTAQFSAVALTGLVAFLLYSYAKRRTS